jgi:predicted dehydrogenase
VQVGSQYLADPVWEKGFDLLKTGVIGKPVHVQIPNFRNSDAGERAMMTIDDPNAKDGVGVDWAKFQADAPVRDFSVTRMFQWRLFMEYSGGPLTDTGPHEMCPVYKMLQPGFPSKVVATGGHFYWNHDRTVPDTMDVLIQYPQGYTIALLETYINNHFPIEKVIRGSEGTALLTNDALEVYPMTRVPYGTTRPPVIELKTSHRLLTVRGEALAAATGTQRPKIADLTIAHLKDFLDSVRKREQPRFDLELGYIVQIPLCMAMRSLLENKAALFDAEREQIRLS